MEWQFHASDASGAVSARPMFTRFLRASCTADSNCDGAEIVFGELLANALRHPPGKIEITVRSDLHGLVTLMICDTGAPFSIGKTLPGGESESGRGLYIVAFICSQLTARRTANGNKVSVVLPVTAKIA